MELMQPGQSGPFPLPGPINGGGLSSIIASIQEVVFSESLLDNDPTGAESNKTIAAVNTDRSIILVHEMSIGGTAAGAELHVRLMSSTNVRLTLTATQTGGTMYIKAYVIEFKLGVLKSAVQEITGASDPQTISSVNTAKSIFIPLTFSGRGGIPLGPVGAEIASATSVDWGPSASYLTRYGLVAEFK